MSTPKRVAVYARVSTANGQTVETQLRELRAVAERHGWEIAETFTDEGISGAKGRDRRPAFDALCRGIARREFDMVAAWSVDRLGRSLQDLIGFLNELHAKGVDLYLHQQGLDTSTPAGRAMFGMLGVFAEFERAIIRERVTAGLARAAERGTRSGRPIGRPKVPARVAERARALREEGRSLREVAAMVGLGVGTVHRLLRAE